MGQCQMSNLICSVNLCSINIQNTDWFLCLFVCSRSLCSRSRSSSSSLLWGLSRILFSSCFSLFLSILIYVEKSVSSKLPRAPVLKGSPALKCSFDNFPEYFFLPVSAAVDPWLTEKREDRKKYYGWPKIIF